MMTEWYESLQRPALTPPGWVFGPVWTVLYIMIAVSIFLFFRRTSARVSYGVILLLSAHLFANFVWTTIFFRLKSPGWALLDILFLDASLIVIVMLFWKRYKPASLVLTPYLGWVLFATYLNAGFYFLNRT
ncbi:MAG: TspO/MBR family protein [Deltaproteobacteria bacterium]|nr:TspO/MBR family protein [Deltaproteobacteria bacterium]